MPPEEHDIELFHLGGCWYWECPTCRAWNPTTGAFLWHPHTTEHTHWCRRCEDGYSSAYPPFPPVAELQPGEA